MLVRVTTNCADKVIHISFEQLSPSNCLSVCCLLQNVQNQRTTCILTFSSFFISGHFAWNQFSNDSHSTLSLEITLCCSRGKFHLWSDLEILWLGSSFCSDASDDIVHTFASITANNASIARSSDCIYQIRLHSIWTFVTASYIRLFILSLGISAERLSERSSLRAFSIPSPNGMLLYKLFQSRDTI